MATVPDVKIRLSPEGVAEVVAAFRKIEREGQRLSKVGAGAFSGLQGAVAGLVRLLPALSVAAGVAAIVAISKNALDAAEAIGVLSEKVGASTENLSVLSVVAKTANVDQDQLKKGLIATALALDGLRAGEQTAVQAFGRIGLSAKKLEGLDTAEVFAKIAEAQSKFADQGRKTAAIADLLGKKIGPDLIPLLNALATEGFDKARERAEAMGLVINRELSDAARRAKDNTTIIGLQVKGLATLFLTGFAPAIGDVMQFFVEQTQVKGGNAMVKFGEIVGDVVKDIVIAFFSLGRHTSALIDRMGSAVQTMSEAGKAATKGLGDLSSITQPLLAGPKFLANLPAATEAFTRGAAREQAIRDAAQADVKKFEADLLRTRAGATPPHLEQRVLADRVDPKVADAALKAEQARLKMLQALLDQELALFQAHAKLKEQREERAFEQGLISLQAYHEKRVQIATEGIDKEISTLQEKRKLAAQSPVKDLADQQRKDQELAKLDNDIAIKRIERVRVEEDLIERQRRALKELAKERLQLEATIFEEEGKHHDAAMLRLRQRIQETSDALKKMGVVGAEADRILSGIFNRGATDAAIQDTRSQGDLGMRQLSTERDAIQRQVATGQLFQFQADQRIIELEKSRLPVLRDTAAQMVRLAEAAFEASKSTGDALKVQEAKEFAAAIEQIAVNIDVAGREMAEFKQLSFNAVQSSLSDFLVNGIRDAKNFGEAIRGLAFSIAQSMQKIQADILAKKITEKAFSLLGIATEGPEKVATAAAAGTAQATPLTAASAALSAAGTMVISGATAISFAAGELMAAAIALTSAGATAGAGAGISSFGGLIAAGAAGAAEGGLVTGPGTGTSDSIPARLSRGEFVMRSAAVQRIGADVLHHMNAGMRPFSINPIHRGVAHFAEGGLVGGGTGSLDGRLDVGIGLSEGLVLEKLDSSAGQRLILNILQRNKRTVKSFL